MVDKKFSEYLKGYFLKNNFVLVFNLLALVSILIGLLSFWEISLRINFLVKLTNIFSLPLWIFLAAMLIISGILAFYNKKRLMFLPVMIWLLWTTALVRTSNMPLLKNAATGEWELGPDLDPYLFLRNAEEIIEGKNFGELDEMRYAPLGAPKYIHGNIMPWSIVGVYKLINLFGEYSITYAAIIAPVIFFILSLIGFFFFVYFLFSFKFSKEKSLVGATIASFLYAFIPSMLHRTVAGIPELESLGIFWFWLAFLFFVLAWKQKKVKFQILCGILAGLFTGAMSWTWGGYKYIYMVLGLAVFLMFLFNVEKKKNFLIFASFLVAGILIQFIKIGNLSSIFTSFTDTGFALGVLFLMILQKILFETKIKEKLKLKKINLPENIITLLVAFLVLIGGLLIINPSFLFEMVSRITGGLLTPFGSGRVGLTVAENRAPYFSEIFSTFGYLFWLFFFGIITLFYQSVKHFNLKERLILNLFFILFLVSFIFSRISQEHFLNGNNFISKILYFGGLILFGVVLAFIQIKAHLKKENKTLEDFKKIGFTYLLLISFSLVGVISMRGAVRLFFMIAPILILLSGYLLIKLSDYLKSKDESLRGFFMIFFIISLLIFTGVVINYGYSTTNSATQIGPSPYNQQWQVAMSWVSENTTENSIFVHWWDYGYWVQTLGGRPTVTDGGHYIDFWDHTTARYLLTTPSPETALSLMKTHNVSYLLIDSTDLGKYSAYSSIGSDESGKDRLSWIPVMPSDERQTQETANGTTKVYAGGSYLDGDIIYVDEERRVFLPEGVAVVGGIILEYSQTDGEMQLQQPKGVYFYNNKREDLPIRYLYYQDRLMDFGSGLNVTMMIIPAVSSSGREIDPLGVAIYLSEKTRNSLFAELYLMDDPLDKYPTLEIAHSEDDYFVKMIKMQSPDFGDFLYNQGFRGPIKIWDTRNIPENILPREEFLYSPEGWNQKNGPFGYLDNLDFIG
jgi:asparagine N-glycosylation enzyme membrane subunit Stt3